MDKREELANRLLENILEDNYYVQVVHRGQIMKKRAERNPKRISRIN